MSKMSPHVKFRHMTKILHGQCPRCPRQISSMHLLYLCADYQNRLMNVKSRWFEKLDFWDFDSTPVGPVLGDAVVSKKQDVFYFITINFDRSSSS